MPVDTVVRTDALARMLSIRIHLAISLVVRIYRSQTNFLAELSCLQFASHLVILRWRLAKHLRHDGCVHECPRHRLTFARRCVRRRLAGSKKLVAALLSTFHNLFTLMEWRHWNIGTRIRNLINQLKVIIQFWWSWFRHVISHLIISWGSLGELIETLQNFADGELQH
jgi:hypothetical protein